MTRITAIDIGHHFSRVISPNGRINFPSLAAPAILSVDEWETDSLDDIQTEPDYRLLQPEHWLVGELAYEQNAAEPTTSPDWPLSREYKMLFLTALTASTDSFKIDTYIITGLPIQSMPLQDQVKEHLMGRHLVRLRDKPPQTIEVIGIKFIPQGTGAFLAQHINESGYLSSNGSTMKRHHIVIDVGSRTTGFVGLRGFRQIDDEMKSEDLGAWTVEEEVRHVLNRRFPELCRNISRAELMMFVQAGSMPYKGGIKELASIRDPILDRLGHRIISVAKSMWGNAETSNVYITGGGALLLGSRVVGAFEHAHLVADPIWGNVDGYDRYGKLALRKKE